MDDVRDFLDLPPDQRSYAIVGCLYSFANNCLPLLTFRHQHYDPKYKYFKICVWLPVLAFRGCYISIDMRLQVTRSLRSNPLLTRTCALPWYSISWTSNPLLHVVTCAPNNNKKEIIIIVTNLRKKSTISVYSSISSKRVNRYSPTLPTTYVAVL